MSTVYLDAFTAVANPPQGGNTELITIPVGEYKRLCVQVKVANQALDAFLVQARFHPGGDFLTLYSLATDFTTPKGIMIGCSGDLTAQGVGNGWLILDVTALDAIKLLASSANVAGSAVTIFVGGQD